MKKRMLRIINCILTVSLTAAALVPAADQGMAVQASTIKDIQNQIKDTQNQLDGINDKISSLTDEQDLVQERIDDLNSEIINTMTSIGIKEDEIAAKEAEIADKQTQIDLTQQEYEAAVERERQQQEDMAVRTRLMYENSKSTYLSIFLAGDGLADILNRMDYIEKIYEYDKQKLEEYIETQNQVQALWEQLEAEKTQLESDKSGLVADREALQSQKVNLDALLAEKKQESANYDAEIKKAQQEASVAKALLQQEQEQLKKLQAQQNQASSGGSTNAANGNYTSTSYTATIDNASGSDLGKKVAKYACQYIGNPYVSGGTSLTNGADCSGFTYRVYKDFGYNLPRTSYEQRSAGAAVSYEEAQPGDLICYDGHVGIYIGGGLIVHASSVRTGIKVSNANYRTILAVRRII